jgi:DNA invertase Pin-like site-specific DNA recombinase
MIHGYARVSTLDQDVHLQLVALKGCSRIWEEKSSAGKRRPELQRMLYSLRRGDVVRVYKLDRVARSLLDLLGILGRIERAGAHLESCTEPIETGSALGRLLLQVLGSFAEFERSLIVERCTAGRLAAAARGVRFGAPRRIDRSRVRALLAEGVSQSQIARIVGADQSTINKMIRSGDLWRDAPESHHEHA